MLWAIINVQNFQSVHARGRPHRQAAHPTRPMQCPAVPACVSEPGQAQVEEAVDAIWQICSQHLRSGEVDQLVLDEVGLAVALGYIPEQTLLAALQQRSTAVDVIITGPSIPPSVMAMADQVTQLRRGL